MAEFAFLGEGRPQGRSWRRTPSHCVGSTLNERRAQLRRLRSGPFTFAALTH
jgi:hypothetical protein